MSTHHYRSSCGRIEVQLVPYELVLRSAFGYVVLVGWLSLIVAEGTNQSRCDWRLGQVTRPQQRAPMRWLISGSVVEAH
jgi:hypothetical protein